MSSLALVFVMFVIAEPTPIDPHLDALPTLYFRSKTSHWPQHVCMEEAAGYSNSAASSSKVQNIFQWNCALGQLLLYLVRDSTFYR